MKINKLTLPISLTATLALLLAGVFGCGRKNTPAAPGENQPPAPEPVPTNSAAPAPATNEATTTVNIPAAPSVHEITNPPPVATTPPATNTPSPTPPAGLPLLTTTTRVVQMPATVPTAPTNFYPGDFSTVPADTASSRTNSKHGSLNSTNYYFRFRAGYEHINYRDNNDSFTLGVKFYAHGDDLRARAGKNGWLIPDFTAEMSYHLVPKPDLDAHPGTQAGTSVRANFFWPWLHWDLKNAARANAVCPLCRPLVLGLGPVGEIGYDRLWNSSDYRLARYLGARLTFNRDGFIEYTAGGTDGLAGTRQQLTAELPVYTSRDGEVRYVLRGQWNRAEYVQPDVLSGGLFVEMPFGTLIKPSKWGDLVPFLK